MQELGDADELVRCDDAILEGFLQAAYSVLQRTVREVFETQGRDLLSAQAHIVTLRARNDVGMAAIVLFKELQNPMLSFEFLALSLLRSLDRDPLPHTYPKMNVGVFSLAKCE